MEARLDKLSDRIDELWRWWYVIPVAALAWIPAIAALRQNNLHMIELRETVVAIDQEAADLKQTEPALLELRSYVLTHMNTKLAGPIELVGSYNKAVEQARAEAAAKGSANADIYKQAQDECERPNVPLTVRAQCMQDYVTSRAVPGTDPSELNFPPKEQFIYDFASPRWSPDAAGWLTLLAIGLSTWSAGAIFMHLVLPRIIGLVKNDPLE